MLQSIPWGGPAILGKLCDISLERLRHNNNMRLVVLIGVLLWLAAIISAPLVAEASGAAAAPIYAAFSWVCHQRPQRTWSLGAYPLAVCVRCLGLYAGALAGAVAGLPFSRAWWAWSMVLLAAEWLAEAIGWLDAPSPIRFAAGLAAGFFSVPALWGNREKLPSVIDG